MIHPMWATFYASAAAGLLSQPNSSEQRQEGADGNKDRGRISRCAAHMADLMCDEYDRRDKSGTGSPYRG